MRRFHVASTALAALVYLLISMPVNAASITYNVIDYPDHQDGYHLSGTITTDGTIGTLTESNFLSWSLLITNGSESHSITPAALQPITVIGDVEATATSLYLPTNVPADQVNYVLALRGDTNRIQWATVNLPSTPDAYSYSGTRRPNNTTYWEHLFDVEGPRFMIASAVPEPSSFVSLAIAATLGAGVLSRRRGATTRSTLD